MPQEQIRPTLTGDESVQALMAPVRALMRRYPDANEISMSKPGLFHVFASGTWHEELVPEVDYARAIRLAEAVGFFVGQEIKEESPLLSTTLPSGERIQFVIPPACDPGQVVLSIRVPSQKVKPLHEYLTEKCFERYRWIEGASMDHLGRNLSQADQELVLMLKERNLYGFLLEAIKQRKNIAVVGDTGSGKTTLMKALCLEIPPHERLVTIEDSRELNLPRHTNKAHLLYAKGGRASKRVSPSELISACMRLFPDRVLLAELRGAEAYDYLKLMTTGHSGSVTSFHAESCALALDRWVFMASEHPDAASLKASDIKRLVQLTMDVFVHITRAPILDNSGQLVGDERYITQVHFDPAGKLALQIDGGRLHG